jgi:APA family basic amino acid/polyamine antiporter
VLGKTHLVTLGIGAIIGAGVFVVPGPAAAQFAGPALVVSLLAAAVGCALAGLCYAEMASLFPVAGSAYSYAIRSLGRLTGWIVGWLLVLEYLFAAAILAVGWSGYFTSLLHGFGWNMPNSFIHSPLSTDATGMLSRGAGVSDLPAVAVLLLAGFVAMRNVKLSATVNAIITVMKVGIILLVIVAALPFVAPTNWHPFVPPNSGRWGEFGFSGIIRGAAITFYVYLGFDTVSVAAQEARNPQRDVPFGIIGSLLTCTVLFVPFVLVLTGLTSYRNLNVPQPTAVALAAVAPHLVWLQVVVEVGAMLGMFSVLMVVLMAEARILYAMSLDGLVPPIFAVIHPRSRTPVAGTLVTTAMACLLAALLPISLLTQMVSVGALVAFISVALGVLVLRRAQPDVVRPFRTPGVPFVPIAAIVICFCLILALPPATWIRSAIWLALGLLIYALYGRKTASPYSTT